MNLITFIVALLLGGESPLALIPPEWNFGRIEGNGGIVTSEVVVENRSGQEVQISFLSTCDCLWITPAELKLGPGQFGQIELAFDPIDERGPVQKDIILRTSLDRLPRALYVVHGEVAGKKPEAGRTEEELLEGGVLDYGSGGEIVDFNASPGCRSCQRLLRRTLPKIEGRTGIPLTVREHNIMDPQVYAGYLQLLSDLGEEERAYPALVVGNTALQGEAAIEGQLGNLLQGQSMTAGDQQPRPESTASGLAVLPVAAAGLLDGVNPCAFTTLVFLISALAVAGRSRFQVLQIGVFFSAAVFVTYLLIGLGFFQAVRMASAFPIVATVIRVLLVAVLLCLAVLSLYDYLQLHAGRTDRVLLQLPQPIKRRLHRDIKSRSRSAALIVSSLVLGFLVSVFELACTGQVYFPTLVYLHQVRQDAGSFSSLLLYNFAFILPLLAVFALSYWGVSSQRLTRWVQGSMQTVKLLLTGLFVGLAVLTLLT